MHARMFPKTFVLLIVLTASVIGQAANTGEVSLARCWSFAVEDGKTLAANGTHIFVGTSGAKVEALSQDGKKLWSTELGGEIVSNLVAGDGGVFLATSIINGEFGKTSGGTLRYLSKDTGITGWAAKLPEADSYSLGIGADSLAVVTSKGAIHAFEPKTGVARWRRELAEGFAGEPRFSPSNVYVASTAQQVFAVSLASGEVLDVMKVQFTPTAVGEISGDVFTGDDRGNLTSLGNDGKANWNFKSGGKISAIVAVGSHLLTASNDNFVYLVTARNGAVAWKRRLDDRISQIGVIDGKFALVSGYEEHGAQLIDISSGKVAGQLNLAEDEFVIARPVSSGGKVFMLTNTAVHGYGTGNTCQ